MTRARAASASRTGPGPLHAVAVAGALAALAGPVGALQSVPTPAVDADTTFGGVDLPAVPKSQPRVVMLTPPYTDVRKLLEPWGGQVLDTVPSLGFHLIGLPLSLTDQQIDAIVEVLGAPDEEGKKIALLVEKERKAATPELLACGFPSSVVQQCTIGIVDGDPSAEELASQPWLEQIGLAGEVSYTAEPRIVAVIDTGVDPNVPWLADRVLPGWDLLEGREGGYESMNGLDDDGDGQFDEGYGHGTHVASTIGLVDPNALILPYRTMDSDGNGSSYHTAKAVIFATLQGASVINLSLSFLHESEFLRHALAFAVTRGVDVFTSAGNTAEEFVLFPATDLEDGAALPGLFPLPPSLFPHAVVSVGSVGPGDVVSEFSAYGAGVELWAPGEAILAAFPGGEFGSWNGTSMATAVASGACSLARSLDPYDQPKSALLIQTAIGIAGNNQPLECEFSGGRIDAAALIEACLGWPTPVVDGE